MITTMRIRPRNIVAPTVPPQPPTGGERGAPRGWAAPAWTPPVDRARERSWFDIRAAAGDTGEPVAEIYIYDEIGGWGIWASDFVYALRQVTAPSIRLRLNSPGGDVFEGVAVYNALVSHPAYVHVMVDGLAASIASVIAMAGDRVTMGRASQIMVHDPWAMVAGGATDLRAMADLLDKIGGQIAGVYADRSGGDAADWAARMAVNGGDGTWMTEDEAVALGLADDVAELPARTQAEQGQPDQAAGSQPTDHIGVALAAALKGVFER